MAIKTQQDIVKIGEQAIVRCVTLEKMYSYLEQEHIKIFNVPVFPYPGHEDSEIIGFTPIHRHCDYRFWTDDMINEHISSFHYPEPSDWPSKIVREEEIIDEYDRVLPCLREMLFLHKDYNFLPKLEEAYADRDLLEGDICPHRRFKVFPNSRLGKDCKTCPGHGLTYKNGKLYPRSQAF
jgi:hypothetical protein